MIVTKTPFRLSLFGGGTDYPDWFSENPGTILSAAMSHYCFLTVKKLPPFFDHRNRVVYSQIENVNNIGDINHPSVKACLQYLEIPEGISITHDADLPAKSGIGSSSAFTVGLLNALYTLKNKSISRENLAKEAIHVEQKIIGENVGIQDQIMASYGGIQMISMGPGNNWSAKPLLLSKPYTRELEKHILLGFTGVSRHAEVQSKKQVDNIKQGVNAHYLNDIKKLAHNAINSLQRGDDMSEIGKLMQDNWQIKKELANGITEEWIDKIYEDSLNHGAYGGKLMGAGGGGFFMFLVPPQIQKQFKEKMIDIKVWVPFKFDWHGSKVIADTRG